MNRSDKAYSYINMVTSITQKGLKRVSGKEGSREILLGALSGTLLAALIVKLSNKSLVLDVAKNKKELDNTYTPLQSHLSKEIESLNKTIVLSQYVGKSLGTLGGHVVLNSLTDKFDNKDIGATVGWYLGGKLADAILIKKREKLESLLLDYNETLSPKQIKLKSKLKLSTDKLGLTWTLGISGGFILGAFVGDSLKPKQIN